MMPNHVISQIIFRNVDHAAVERILSKVRSDKRQIDFEVLLPIPLNVWRGSVGTIHTQTFPDTALDWCTNNWSTKWDAYGIDEGGRYKSIAEGDGTLTLTFQTAWRPPYGWLLALLYSLDLPFEHNWLDEGASRGRSGRFQPHTDDFGHEAWTEVDASESVHRHLHNLMWGVEQFPDEAA